MKYCVEKLFPVRSWKRKLGFSRTNAFLHVLLGSASIRLHDIVGKVFFSVEEESFFVTNLTRNRSVDSVTNF